MVKDVRDGVYQDTVQEVKDGAFDEWIARCYYTSAWLRVDYVKHKTPGSCRVNWGVPINAALSQNSEYSTQQLRYPLYRPKLYSSLVRGPLKWDGPNHRPTIATTPRQCVLPLLPLQDPRHLLQSLTYRPR